MVDTIKYYDENAKRYVDFTLDIDISANRDPFIRDVQTFIEHDEIEVLDFGAGSCRDTIYFRDKLGWNVTPTDASSGLINEVKSRFNIEVEHATYETFNPVGRNYDVIWAMSSLLHCDIFTFERMFEKFIMASRDRSVFYISTLYGDDFFEDDGREFLAINETYMLSILEDMLGTNYFFRPWVTKNARRKYDWFNMIILKY